MIGVGTTIFLVRPQTFAAGTSYLLDTYSAAAAYSLRQLKTGVTNVVRVRRSGDSAESDFTATEITDGTLTTWTGANDGFVVTWYDQSGSGNDVTQATAGNQPQIVSSGSVLTLNSKPTITYNGSTNYLNYSTGVLNQNDISVFSVSNNTVSNGVGAVVSFSDTGAGSKRVFCDRRTNNVNSIISTTGTGRTISLSVTRNDANQRLLSTFVDNTNAFDGYDNGDYTSTPSAPLTFTGTWTSDAVQIGRQSTGLSYLTGNVQEVIVFNTDESANRTDIESDINTHYSIY